MKIEVLLFASLREAAGASRVEIEVEENATARRVAEALAVRFPALRPHLPGLAFACEGEFVSAETVLPPASELALLPPVSGG